MRSSDRLESARDPALFELSLYDDLTPFAHPGCCPLAHHAQPILSPNDQNDPRLSKRILQHISVSILNPKGAENDISASPSAELTQRMLLCLQSPEPNLISSVGGSGLASCAAHGLTAMSHDSTSHIPRDQDTSAKRRSSQRSTLSTVHGLRNPRSAELNAHRIRRVLATDEPQSSHTVSPFYSKSPVRVAEVGGPALADPNRLQTPQQEPAVAPPSSTPRAISVAPKSPLLQRVCDACELGKPTINSVQRNLTIGAPDDAFEREADRVARHVMRIRSSARADPTARHHTSDSLQRMCSRSEFRSAERQVQRRQNGMRIQRARAKCFIQREDTEHLRFLEHGPRDPARLHLVQRVLDSPGNGRPVSPTIRAYTEPALNADLSVVRIHSDENSRRAAHAIHARAFTHGRDIFLGEGQSSDDLGLMAHELTHTVQQGASPTLDRRQSYLQESLSVSDADGTREVEAERTAGGLVAGARRYGSERGQAPGSRPTLTAPNNTVQRDNVLEAMAEIISLPFENSHPGSLDPRVTLLFDLVTTSSILSASEITIPSSWTDAVREYATSNPLDGIHLWLALGRDPSFWRGGVIMDAPPDADAKTLDDHVFVDGSLSLSTYVHELVHVGQYTALGKAGFLASYFGASAFVIVGRLLAGEPLEPMRSNPHESAAYALEARFNSWYQTSKGARAEDVTV